MSASTPAPGVIPTMNATPLMDVMLVLVVVFMVVTPLIHSGPDLVPPRAVRGEKVPDEPALRIRLSFKGELSSESRRWSVEELAGLVEEHP
jgi:biopolymer transport protein ExbD